MRIARIVIVAFVATASPTRAADAPLPPISLAETLRLAVAESPNLAAQRALAESARISVGPAGALPDPKMKIAEENWPTNTSERWTRYEVMQMLRLGFSQEFPGGEKLALRTQRANEDLQQRVTTIDVQKAVVQREAAIAWITRYFADQAEARVADQIAEAELAVESGSAQYRAGRTTQAELVALQSAVVDLKNRRAEAGLEAKRARIALARFIGPEADRPLGDPPDLSRLPAAAAGAVEEDQLPEVRSALSREAVVAADANLAREDYWPDWKVEVSYTWRGNQPFVQIPGLPPTFAGDPYPHNVSLEFTVDLPIFTRTRQGPRLEAKLKELDAARALREAAQRQQLAEVQAMIAEWESAHQQAMRIRDELIPLTVQKREAALAAYRGGTGTLAAVLEARRDDLDARLSLVRQELAAGKAWAWLDYIFPAAGQ
jgi:outer membrane protein TolC